jgi:hypothetical protein
MLFACLEWLGDENSRLSDKSVTQATQIGFWVWVAFFFFPNAWD